MRLLHGVPLVFCVPDTMSPNARKFVSFIKATLLVTTSEVSKDRRSMSRLDDRFPLRVRAISFDIIALESSFLCRGPGSYDPFPMGIC